MMDLVRILNWESGQEPVRKRLYPGLIWPDMGNHSTDLFSFLLMAGYLTAENVEKNTCDLLFPNGGIRGFFNLEVLGVFFQIDSLYCANLLMDLESSLQKGNITHIQYILHKLFLKTVGTIDLTLDTAHHMLMLLICKAMDDDYYVSTERESEGGRHVIQLEPKREDDPGIILKLKTLQEKPLDVKQVLEDSAHDALAQSKGKAVWFGTAEAGHSPHPYLWDGFLSEACCGGRRQSLMCNRSCSPKQQTASVPQRAEAFCISWLSLSHIGYFSTLPDETTCQRKSATMEAHCDWFLEPLWGVV